MSIASDNRDDKLAAHHDSLGVLIANHATDIASNVKECGEIEATLVEINFLLKSNYRGT